MAGRFPHDSICYHAPRSFCLGRVFEEREKTMKKAILLSLVLLLIATTQSSAETRSVPTDYRTIQLAINAGTHGDVVVVWEEVFFVFLAPVFDEGDVCGGF